MKSKCGWTPDFIKFGKGEKVMNDPRNHDLRHGPQTHAPHIGPRHHGPHHEGPLNDIRLGPDHTPHEPIHPHPPGIAPHTPHNHGSSVKLIFDEDSLNGLTEIYEDRNYLTDIIERSPPETKLNFAIGCGIKVLMGNSPQPPGVNVRFSHPFLTENNSNLIMESIQCADPEKALKIYRSRPPEQALLGLILAVLRKKE
ncbi:MAG: hypothetical protein LBR53_03265 [Deltaproteobacteria bacterium]|nr:hypothetical protein [Deltaproteobacteria bacterium]